MLAPVFWKAVHWFGVDNFKNVLKMETTEPKKSPFLIHTFFFLFMNLVPYITHNAAWLLSDITGGNSPDYMQRLLGPQKALYDFLPYAVVLPKTWTFTQVNVFNWWSIPLSDFSSKNVSFVCNQGKV